MWPFLVACASPPEPDVAAVVTTVAASPPPPWTLQGRASSDGLDTPTLPGGAALLGAACATLNATLHGSGPPCFVEDWRADGARLRVERAGARLRFDRVPGRTTWTPIGGILASCLGDPLAAPPADDPGGRRTLEKRTWVITLSGQNRCALTGTLRLDATRDHAEWSGISSEGLPWSSGGREAAQTLLRAELRALVESKWGELDTVQREEALQALAADPHPDARRVLELRR
ncbi:MAG: hypothetical protein Q8P18_19550 [Pseudomonadota bacterium]|nr:hypothetical protein [Pseudomonadota bacterium]